MAKQKEPTYQSTSFYDKNFQLIGRPVVKDVTKQFPAIKYALLMLVAAIGLYVINFSLWPFVGCINSNGFSECALYGFSSKRDEWGQFGDFVGGLVNPFIGLLTIYLLVTTISQQSRALDQTENALDHANTALEQNEKAIKQAYKALKQNAAALEITQREFERGISVQLDAKIIQDATKKALEEELSIAKSKAIRTELESMIDAFEAELDDLKNKKFSPSLSFKNESNQSISVDSLDGAIKKGANWYSLNGIASGNYSGKQYESPASLLRECKIVMGLLIGATCDLMPYLNTDYAKAYWQNKAVKSINIVHKLGIFNEDEKALHIIKVGTPP